MNCKFDFCQDDQCGKGECRHLAAPVEAAQPSDEQIIDCFKVVIVEGDARQYMIAVGRKILALSPLLGVLVEPAGWQIDLSEEESQFLRNTIGHDGDCPPISLSMCNGHSGWGVYVWESEYPEEGASLLCKYAAPAVPLGVTEEPAPDAYLTSTLRAEPVAVDAGNAND